MACRQSLPAHVDTVIVGGGPASLVISYILHGHIPYYAGRHHDDLLHAHLSRDPCLLSISPNAYAHFFSSLRYSTQALPLNTLLDTLVRPNADTEINSQSCVEWRKEPDKAITHLVLSSAAAPGGQWVESATRGRGVVGTLSYAEMISLPGYSYAEHYRHSHGRSLPDFERPAQAEVARYFAEYPACVGIAESFVTCATVHGVSRTRDGFHIASHNIRCRHLVLASGIFSVHVAPSVSLEPLLKANDERGPLLVVGSGFSAADVILSAPPNRQIIHVFKWTPETRPSPLRGCHQQAYPEYAGVYRQMKLAAISSNRTCRASSPMLRRKPKPFADTRDWASVYEGLPNAQVIRVKDAHASNVAVIRLESGEMIERKVGRFAYVVGRRGSLDYLDEPLHREVLADTSKPRLISGRTLRAKVENSFELAPNVFAVGSLTGDSLVRHVFGGCVTAAGHIISRSTNGRASPKSAVNGATSISEEDKSRVPHMGCSSTGAAHEDVHASRRAEVRR